MDNPLPDYVASIAQSLSTQVWWNQQNVIGSPIRARTRGGDPNGVSFPGYRSGKNRDGVDMNVVSELRQPQTIGGERYDTLVITERNDLVNTLIWERTVEYTRHFHDRLIEGNPRANSYLYHSWLSVPDKRNPASWITYERTVAPAWQCVATRINQSLQAEGRSDRVSYLPAGLALARLVELATQGSGVAGITGNSVQETVDRIFNDNVHLTPLGAYYMALVNYAFIYRRSPVGAWAPEGVSTTQALSLQTVAWAAVRNHYNTFVAPNLAQCLAAMRDSVCSAFSNYFNLPAHTAGCVSIFTATTQSNPFYYNAATDRTFWFPPP